MHKTKKVTIERLHERLYIDEAGVLRWRCVATMPKQWNAVWAGREAFTAIDGKGYRHGSLDYTYLRLHRVMWALEHGAWPVGEIDHIDGDRLNNKSCNLRHVSAPENHRNQKRGANNTSGYVGVSWYRPYAKWRAGIGHEGKTKHLGYFDSIEDAVHARQLANAVYRYHANHGRD